MVEIFQKGGPIMWPLLLCSVLTLAVVVERVLFSIGEMRHRSRGAVNALLEAVAEGRLDEARRLGGTSRDIVVRVLEAGLSRRPDMLEQAILSASAVELNRYNRGLTLLDTVVTLAPLLGLMGTVTGMIRTFGLLGGSELGAPQAVTGGIAEALIATAFGLGIAIVALVPLNVLNAQMEKARFDIESAAAQLELHIRRP